MLDRFRQKLGQTWDRRRPADGVAAVHRGLDIPSSTISSSPLYNIPLQDLHWLLPLPEDVTHYIIQSYFWSDLQSLRDLASSCRCLSLLCRPLSFRVVTILPVVNDVTSHARRFALVIQQYPEITSFIQDLRILNIWSVLAQIPQSAGLSKSNVLQDYIKSLAEICTKPFPALKRCRLDIQSSWDALPKPISSGFAQLLATPTLQHLAYVSGGVSLPIMQSHFQQLQSLVFSGYFPIINAQNAADHRPNTSKLSLRHLYYNDVSIAASITKDLTEAIDFSTLQSLHVEILHASPIALTSQSLSRLQELTLQLDVYLAPGMTTNLDLQPLHSLQRLQVNVDVSMSSRPFKSRVSSIAEILRLSPKGLAGMGMKIKERISIHVEEFNEAWETLDVLFTDNYHETWPRLRAFDVTYFDCPDEDKAMPGWEKNVDDIRKALPLLKASGILNVEVIRDPSKYISLYHSRDSADY